MEPNLTWDSIEINGVNYPLSMKLRVAYEIQKQHNHKAYTEVFSNMGTMTLEEQINILYASFKCANREETKKITQGDFLDAVLDNYTLSDVMNYIKAIISGIMGRDITEEDTVAALPEQAGASDEKNGTK